MITCLLRVREVAETLGISRPMVYKLISQGALPACRFGKAVRVQQESLERYISVNQTQNGASKTIPTESK